MKIVFFSINPLFPHKVNGGSPKHLRNVAVHLGELGHEVTILCTGRADNAEPFRWHKRVEVLPKLPFKQPFPQPYDTPAYNIAFIIHEVAEHLVDADRFYLHDGELLFPPIYQHIPTIYSIRDNVYPETILGTFLFQGDALIAVSDYSVQLYRHTAGRFLTDLSERIVTVNNGIDFDKFKPTPLSDTLRTQLEIQPDTVYLLHPHRPEPSKGLRESLAVLDGLVNQHGLSQVKLLVSRWFDAALSGEVRDYYQALSAEIELKGLAPHVQFYDWLDHQQMPEYYSLGTVTLCLGHYVDASGNVPYESLACGTPSIVSRTSMHRDWVPDPLMHKVHYGDHAQATAYAAEIIKRKQRTSAETLAYLREHYDVARQLQGYADAILNATKKPAMGYRFEPLTAQTPYRLSPWCYQSGPERFYHDFLAEHRPLPALAELLSAYPEGFSQAQATQAGLSAETVRGLYKDGYLAPVV